MAKDNKFEIRQRRYLNKTFDELRQDMLGYIKSYYPDKLQDFSENSILGSMLDMCAYVGDNLSFYLDHQVSELNPETAIENTNLETHIRNSGLKIVGSSPATTELTIAIEVPADPDDSTKPLFSSLPIVKNDSVFSSQDGINFRLYEDIDFREKDDEGNYVASLEVGQVDDSNNTISYIMRKTGVCVSGRVITETFPVGNFTPFKQIKLSNPNVTEIISVTDSFDNTYYEVSDLTDNVAYEPISSISEQNKLVKDSLKLISVPFRYTTQVDVTTRSTTLTFGGGKAETFNDDIIPDPSEFAIPMYGKYMTANYSLNPNNLLNTKTLGVISENSTLSISYRYGGGIQHNVQPRSITTIIIKSIDYPGNPGLSVARSVNQSISVYNLQEASGGENPPNLAELRNYIKSAKNSQSRIVTREDLLGRVYSMPSSFGRVFRATVKNNPKNPLAAMLYVISRNANNQLIISPDRLKNNLKLYLNRYRMISDAIDILDASVYNLKLQFKIIVDTKYNKSDVLKEVLNKLSVYFNIDNFYIDQPILISEVISVIISTPGVIAMDQFPDKSLLKFSCVSGESENRIYSKNYFDIDLYTRKGIIVPPPGGILEFKYLEFDILGTAS